MGKWNDQNLNASRQLLITSSNADGVVEREDGTLLFVEPYQTQENFVDFMHYVQKDSSFPPPSPPQIRNVKYAQTRKAKTP